MTQLEFDTAWRDILTLYNCGALLVTMLSVDEPLRHEALYLRVIERLWPDVLTAPINPHKKKKSTVFTQMKKRIRDAARRIPIVQQWRDTKRPKS